MLFGITPFLAIKQGAPFRKEGTSDPKGKFQICKTTDAFVMARSPSAALQDYGLRATQKLYRTGINGVFERLLSANIERINE